jgi:hypothetical protein
MAHRLSPARGQRQEDHVTRLLDHIRRNRAVVVAAFCGVAAVSCACAPASGAADSSPGAVASATIAAVAAPGQGNQTRTAKLPAGKVCDGSISLVSIRVVDAKGSPVNDAVIELRRVRDATLFVRIDNATGDRGDYALLDDSGLTKVAADGEPFDAEVSSRGRKAVARLTIGRRPPAKCHVALLAGPSIVTLK